MWQSKKVIKIVVTGPESSGKSTLSELLAHKLNAGLIPEYARSYMENLQRKYNYNDLEVIARQQVQQEKLLSQSKGNGIIVMDTWLIMTKVWFDVVFGKVPEWLEENIAAGDVDLFLVCKPDLPWIPDPVRENGGEMRNVLFERYCNEIAGYGYRPWIVEGEGEIRLQNALFHIETAFPGLTFSAESR